MKNQVIKNLNPEMGKEIIKYWQSRGFNTGEHKGEKRVYRYYLGVIDGKFNCYSHKEVMMSNAEIIELPEPLPQKVIATDVNGDEFETYLIHEVTIGKPHLKYIVVTPLTIEYFENGEKYYMMTVPNVRQIHEIEKKIKDLKKRIDEALELIEKIQTANNLKK
jgi:hypothetical protein